MQNTRIWLKEVFNSYVYICASLRIYYIYLYLHSCQCMEVAEKATFSTEVQSATIKCGD